MRSRPSPTAPAADLALIGLVFALRLALPLEPCDDAFIVLAVVRNALGGFGPHLVPGDAVLSTWLWPALVALPTALGVDPVVALGALGLGAELALALLTRRLATALSGSVAAGAFAAAALATHPVLRLSSGWGMETPLVLALLAGGFLALERERTLPLAICLGLLPWARFDAALAAIVLLGAAFAKDPVKGRKATAALAVGAAVGLSVFPLHWMLFGTWLPASVSAKAAAATGGWWAGAVAVAAEFGRAAIGESAYWLVAPSVHLALVPLALVGAWKMARVPGLGRRLAPLALWGGLYVAAFALSGREYARNFPWYFAPPLLLLAVLAAVGAGGWLAAWERRAGRLAPALAAGLALLVLLAALPGLGSAFVRVRGSFTAWRERSYAATATWLARHGPARSVASNEIGTLAWFSPPGTRIVDLFGIARGAGEAATPWLELARRHRPEAVVTRADFRYRRELEAADPAGWVWVRAGALDLGLEPALAARLAPHAEALERLFAEVRLDRAPAFGEAAADIDSAAP
ncbi:MAG TPA: hypothetical protein VLA66_06315 [Thermoanaerobaculia bacterium]|nr:hypothetical protein [Thermoanaerobaculia bacterium]